jgi:hypothetical protein
VPVVACGSRTVIRHRPVWAVNAETTLCGPFEVIEPPGHAIVSSTMSGLVDVATALTRPPAVVTENDEATSSGKSILPGNSALASEITVDVVVGASEVTEGVVVGGVVSMTRERIGGPDVVTATVGGVGSEVIGVVEGTVVVDEVGLDRARLDTTYLRVARRGGLGVVFFDAPVDRIGLGAPRTRVSMTQVTATRRPIAR